ncbi:MAG: FtsW/RodA/SpoVE family cell cycle protein, partial [Dehalococcoidia bacterium]
MIALGRARHFDFIMILTSAALVAYGALLIYSATLSAYPDGIAGLGHPVAKHIAFALGGFALTLIVAWSDYRLFGQIAPALYALAIVMLVVVLFVGESAYGSRRWIPVFGTPVQAS